MIPKKVKKQLVHSAVFDKRNAIKKAILKKAREKKQILYGARALQIHNPLFSRETKDFDIMAKKPKASADELQRELDSIIGYDYFFSKPAMHKGTYKVKGKGLDLRKETKDDIEVVDYTELPSPLPKFIKKKGLKIRALKEEIKAKQKSIADPEFAFRHEKDKEYLRRTIVGMQLNRTIKNLIG